jgi:hypothetical protein
MREELIEVSASRSGFIYCLKFSPASETPQSEMEPVAISHDVLVRLAEGRFAGCCGPSFPACIQPL